MSNPSQPSSDPVHVLPEPVPFRPDEPFVGNVSVDDNVLEGIRVVLWNATRGHDHGVVANIADGAVVLSGRVTDEAERQRCVEAVEGTVGVKSVTNRLQCAGEPEASQEAPMIFATRFCQLQTASVLAAVEAGLQALVGEGDPKGAIVIYRNRRPETITVEIGLPLAQAGTAVRSNGFRLGTAPAGPALAARLDESGLHGLLKAHDGLVEQARRTGNTAADFFWHDLASDPQPFAAGLEIHLALTGTSTHEGGHSA